MNAATSRITRRTPSYRQRAGERFARRRWLAAPSAAARLRLDVLRDELARALDEKDAARLMLIVAEGLHEGVFLGVTYIVRRPFIVATVDVDGPPYRVTLRTTMPRSTPAEGRPASYETLQSSPPRSSR